MRLFDPPLCLLCGAPLPVVKTWWRGKTAPRLGFFLTQKTGVNCPSCGTAYIILQKWAVVCGAICFFGGIILGVLSLIALSKILGYYPNVVFGVPIFLVGVWAQIRIAPLFSRVRIAKNNEPADFPLSRYRHKRI